MLADVRQAQDKGEVVPIGICLGEDREVRSPRAVPCCWKKCSMSMVTDVPILSALGLGVLTSGEILSERSYLMVEASYIEDEEEPLDVASSESPTGLYVCWNWPRKTRVTSLRASSKPFPDCQSAALPMERSKKYCR